MHLRPTWVVIDDTRATRDECDCGCSKNLFTRRRGTVVSRNGAGQMSALDNLGIDEWLTIQAPSQ